MSAPGAAVVLEGVSRRYGEVDALRDVSLALEPGRFLVLLGPSGSGKSTLIRCLSGTERVSAGTIDIAGRRVSAPRVHVPSERRELAMVFQDFALWPHLSVERNVAFALRRRRLERGDAAQRVSSMLARVGISHLRARYPPELSGGEQQRVALARALVAEPALLLFDEPLSSLDANLRERLRIEIGTLAHETGATAVYITHDQGEAFALGDEVGVLERGRLVQHGAPEAIFHHPASAFVARFTGLAGALHGRVTGLHPLPGNGRGGPPRQGDPPGAGAGTRVTLTAPGLAPASILATAPTPLRVGAAVQVLVRPTAVRLQEPGAEGTLSGEVLDAAFRGRGYDHVVRLPDGSTLTELFDEFRRPRGTAVALQLLPAGCFAFPDDATLPHPVSTLSSEAPAPDAGNAGSAGNAGRETPQPDHEPMEPAVQSLPARRRIRLR
jgi:iron(III) transport system ATP-binding protein